MHRVLNSWSSLFDSICEWAVSTPSAHSTHNEQLSSFLLCASFPHSSTSRLFMCSVLAWKSPFCPCATMELDCNVAWRTEWIIVRLFLIFLFTHSNSFFDTSLYSLLLHRILIFFLFRFSLTNCAFVSVGSESLHANNTNHVFISFFSFVLVSFPGNKATRIKTHHHHHQTSPSTHFFFLSFLCN